MEIRQKELATARRPSRRRHGQAAAVAPRGPRAAVRLLESWCRGGAKEQREQGAALADLVQALDESRGSSRKLFR